MRLLLVMLFAVFVASPVVGMEVTPDGDQLVLSGAVLDGDLERIGAALEAAPGIRTIILRDSPGGDAPTGYRVGEMLRARGLRTAVSGYCVSSCSRMFLGGIERAFTDDMPPARTFVGFHGHYDGRGELAADYVRQMGLADWIMRFTDGKADKALVERWINIGRSSGLASFYPPSAPTAAVFCDAPAGTTKRPPCETLGTTALAMGITTTDALVHSHRRPALPRASGWAEIDDVGRLPTGSERVRAHYLAFLNARMPRAIALSRDGEHAAWRAGLGENTAWALRACAGFAGQECALYAVDDAVVWGGP